MAGFAFYCFEGVWFTHFRKAFAASLKSEGVRARVWVAVPPPPRVDRFWRCFPLARAQHPVYSLPQDKQGEFFKTYDMGLSHKVSFACAVVRVRHPVSICAVVAPLVRVLERGLAASLSLPPLRVVPLSSAGPARQLFGRLAAMPIANIPPVRFVQAAVTYALFQYVVVDSALTAACYGAWLWLAFSAPLLHHDVWQMHAPRLVAINQSAEAIGSVIVAVVVSGVGVGAARFSV